MPTEVWRNVQYLLTEETTHFTNFPAVFSVSLFTFVSLQSNATVTHLELEDNHILAEGAKCIAEMLRENCSLQELVPNLI